MATSSDYSTGGNALAAYMKTAIESMVAAGEIPSFAEGMAESFVAKLAPGGAKATIDAVEAARAKGTNA